MNLVQKLIRYQLICTQIQSLLDNLEKETKYLIWVRIFHQDQVLLIVILLLLLPTDVATLLLVVVVLAAVAAVVVVVAA